MICEELEGLVCDLDGVIYRGNDPIPGAADAVRRLRAAGVRLVFSTNNSSATVEEYVAKLAAMDVSARRRDVLTSAIVTAEMLASRGLAGRRAIVIGGNGIRQALTAAGLDINDDLSSRRADLVVVGWDPFFDFEAMKRASLAVLDGAALIATNDDAAYPAPDGLWPGAGAILASIETASGRRAEVMGKPHDPMMSAAAARLGGVKRIGVLGDRPETDLAGAPGRGWSTILVLSGVTKAEEVAALDPSPDLVIESLADLCV